MRSTFTYFNLLFDKDACIEVEKEIMNFQSLSTEELINYITYVVDIFIRGEVLLIHYLKALDRGEKIELSFTTPVPLETEPRYDPIQLQDRDKVFPKITKQVMEWTVDEHPYDCVNVVWCNSDLKCMAVQEGMIDSELNYGCKCNKLCGTKILMCFHVLSLLKTYFEEVTEDIINNKIINTIQVIQMYRISKIS